MGRAARVRGRARRAADRRRRDLRRARQRRPPRPSRAVPTRLVAGAPPDAFSDDRAAVGQPAVRLAGAAPAPATAGGSSGCGGRCRCSTWPGSTTSAASSPTGRCRRARGRALPGRWQRGPGRALFDGVRRSARRRLPLVAEDLGVITPAGRARCATRSGSRDARAPVRLRPGRPRAARTRSRTTSRTASSTRGPTTTTRRGLVRGSLDAERRSFVRRRQLARCRRRGARAVVGPDPAGARPRRRGVAIVQAQDVLGLGSEARMNDPGGRGGNWRWQLEAGALTPALARRLREATEARGGWREGVAIRAVRGRRGTATARAVRAARANKSPLDDLVRPSGAILALWPTESPFTGRSWSSATKLGGGGWRVAGGGWRVAGGGWRVEESRTRAGAQVAGAGADPSG